ncbi:MAG: NlpC/P60 family protein [Ferrimicrobium sp.]
MSANSIASVPGLSAAFATFEQMATPAPVGQDQAVTFMSLLSQVQTELSRINDPQSSTTGTSSQGGSSTQTLNAPSLSGSLGVSSSPYSPAVLTSSTAISPTQSVVPISTGTQVVSSALGQLGVPYVWGGSSPSTGFDCSGLVQYAFGQSGVTLPRTAAEQEQTGQQVSSLAAAQPGDLVFYGSPAYHVGIYLGDGYMVDAPQTGQAVQIAPVGTPTEIRNVLGISVQSASSTSIPANLSSTFAAAAASYNLPANLLPAVAQTESSMNPTAISSAGAEGIMQLMPTTAASLGVNPMDPTQAIWGAAQLLAGKIQAFGSVPLALAAYNAGDQAVKNYGGIPPYSQTQNYVAKVMSLMQEGG